MNRTLDIVTARAQRGLSMVELMVAMAIGLFMTFGIFTLFEGVSRSNRLQAGLARLQESGRYAVGRIEEDLRMSSAQYCSNFSGNAHTGASRPIWSGRTPVVFAPALNFPDSGGMQSVTAAGVRSVSAATGAAYALSPRFFMQGYSCTTGTTCTPGLPVTGMFPAAGLADGRRVPNTDILTIRYLRGTGWPVSSAGVCGSGGSLTLVPQPGDDTPNFAVNQLALVSECQNPSILPVANVTGNVIGFGPMLSGVPGVCAAQGTRDVRVFNFSTDFVTITYYLAFRTDQSPDARPNVGAQRLVPVLIRRENGTEQEVVRGVDLLTFRYGVVDRLGEMRFLTAAQVDSRLGNTIQCPLKPEGVNPTPTDTTQMEPGCLWRSVSRIEAHLLVNSEEEVIFQDAVSRSFRYMGTQYSPTNDASPLPSTLAAGSMPRREFVAQVSARNGNP